jgi:hypothetical protein
MDKRTDTVISMEDFRRTELELTLNADIISDLKHDINANVQILTLDEAICYLGQLINHSNIVVAEAEELIAHLENVKRKGHR